MYNVNSIPKCSKAPLRTYTVNMIDSTTKIIQANHVTTWSFRRRTTDNEVIEHKSFYAFGHCVEQLKSSRIKNPEEIN